MVAALGKYIVKDYYIGLVQHPKQGLTLPGQPLAASAQGPLAIGMPSAPQP